MGDSYYSEVYSAVDEKEAFSRAIEQSRSSEQVFIPEIKMKDWAIDEYLFVLDYFQSLGLEYTPAVLKYESQHPEVRLDRKALAKRYSLDKDCKTPLIVQLMAERLGKIGNV